MDKGHPVPPEPALMALIARELATEAYKLDEICTRYGISEEYFAEFITDNEYFKRVLKDYTKEWHALGSTHKRLAFFAAAALEEKLPILADRMGSRSSELTDAVNAAKLFRDLAGIAPPSPVSGVASGTPFSISINFGDRKIALETKNVEASVIDVRPDADAKDSLKPIRLLPKGAESASEV
jgi:hypothetical protein